jgi:hypothetical protein
VFASFAKFGIHDREARTPGGTPGSAAAKPPRFSASGTPGSAAKGGAGQGGVQMDGFRCRGRGKGRRTGGRGEESPAPLRPCKQGPQP